MSSFFSSDKNFARMVLRAICTATFALLLSTQQTFSNEVSDAIRIDGVIGTDDRKLVDSLAPPWNAVGRINIQGYRKRQHCTGTLIAPNKVVTAAHCLIDHQSGTPVSVDRIHFLAGVLRGVHLAHGRAACVDFLGPSQTGRTVQQDVAIITLTEKLQIAPAPVSRANPATADQHLIHAGYTRDRPHSLAADSRCSLHRSDATIWLTDCDTNFGASGGPVFVSHDGEFSLVAIMVGYAKGKHSIAVPSDAWQDLISGSNCEP